METLGLAAVLLLAVFVGLMIPVLLQLRATLKRAESFLDVTTVSIDTALAEATRLTARLNRVVDEIEGHLPRVQRVAEATDGLVDTIDRLRAPLRVAAAMGPAALAAGRSLFASFMASRGQDGQAETPVTATPGEN